MKYINDINKETANQAFYNTSFSPEKRGESVRNDYNNTLVRLEAFINENAKEEKPKIHQG